MNPKQLRVFADYFAPYAKYSVIDGSVYIDDGFDYVGDPKTWIIKPNGDVYREFGNPVDGYEQELANPYLGEV